MSLIALVQPLRNSAINSNVGTWFDMCATNTSQLMLHDQVNDLRRMHRTPPYPSQSPINDAEHVVNKHKGKKKTKVYTGF